MNPQTKKLEESKKFSLSELPNKVGFNGKHMICSYKKDYQSYNIEKNFALAKGPLQSKNPFFKVTGPNQWVFFMDDIGLFMDSQFQPIQKDNITLTTGKTLIDIGLQTNYCLILCEGALQIFSICKSILRQMTPKDVLLFKKLIFQPISEELLQVALLYMAEMNCFSSIKYQQKRKSRPCWREVELRML